MVDRTPGHALPKWINDEEDGQLVLAPILQSLNAKFAATNVKYEMVEREFKPALLTLKATQSIGQNEHLLIPMEQFTALGSRITCKYLIHTTVLYPL